MQLRGVHCSVLTASGEVRWLELKSCAVVITVQAARGPKEDNHGNCIVWF